MSQSEIITAQTVDLTSCDLEPIHLCGLIQPHGVLFVLKEPHLEILQISNNTFDFLGIHPQNLLHKKMQDLLDPEQTNSITSCLSENFDSINPIKISLKVQNKNLSFDGIVHRLNGIIIIELEPQNNLKKDISFLGFHHLVKGALGKMQHASTLSDICQVIVKEVRKITGFDRVMVYQFNNEGAGKVIAEDKVESLYPYLDLHYPASDIPEPIRHLSTLNLLRLIPNVNCQPVEITPANNPATGNPLDLSLSVLRSVSPCHVEYLKNMDVAASMSISLIRDNKLWGFIACHHHSVKYIDYELRTACEFLGQVMSLELAAKEDNEDLDYRMKLKLIQSKFIEYISQEDNFVDGLVKNKSELLDLVSAQGVVMYSDDHFTLIGKTPQEADIKDLMTWVEAEIHNNVFYTDSLPKNYPSAEKFSDVASGLLALSISKSQNNYILWFRPEVIQTVNWGGNPHQSVEAVLPSRSQETRERRLPISPRKSFELWQETVRLKSLPWKQCEIDASVELRSAIVGIVLRKADELAKINIELERSNSELDAFAYIASHDLKEPLRGIHNYSSFLLEDYANILNEEGVSKLQTLVRLTQRMEDLINSLLHFSRLGRVELSMQKTNLNELVNNVIDVLSISLKEIKVDIRIPRPLPSVQCDQVQVSEVFSNLLSNAIKYNDQQDKWVEISFLDSVHQSNTQDGGGEKEQEENKQLLTPLIFYVRDNGIGIQEKHKEAIFRIFKRLHGPNKYGGGTGAGLTIAKKIVERHGGTIWLKSTYGEGSTFYFTLQS